MTYGNIGEFANRDLPLTAWVVDATTGNDNNKGDAAAPLLTLAELQRRFEGRRVTANTTVTLIGSLTSQNLTLDSVIPNGVTLTVQGVATTAASGTITTFTALNAATSQPAQILDASVVWATHVKRRIRMTSGAASGALAWVLKDLGANTARVSQFTNTAGTAANPANGDTYVIETLDTVVGALALQVLGGGTLLVADLTLNGSATTTYLFAGQNTTLGILRGCDFITNITNWRTSALTIRACQVQTNQFFRESNVSINGLAANNAAVNCRFSAGLLFLSSASCWQEGGNERIFAGHNSYLEHSVPLGFFDGAASDAVVRLDTTGTLTAPAASNILWGVGNLQTNGVRVASGGRRYYMTIDTLTGVTNDTILGGAATTYAAIVAAPSSSIITANDAGYVLRVA